MTTAKQIRKQAMEDPKAVNLDILEKKLKSSNKNTTRHAVAAARKVAYSRPEEGQQLREPLEQIVIDSDFSSSITRNAQKALSYLGEPSEEYRTSKPHRNVEAKKLRELVMRSPGSVTTEALRNNLKSANLDSVRHATAAARKMAYIHPSRVKPLETDLEKIATGSQYSQSTQTNAKKALKYLDDATLKNPHQGGNAPESPHKKSDSKKDSTATKDDGDTRTVVYRDRPSDVGGETAVFEGETESTRSDSNSMGRKEQLGQESSGDILKYCPNCGTDLRNFDVVNFCPGCSIEFE